MRFALKAAIIAAAFGALVAAGCETAPPPSVPQVLVGTWSTQTESHAGRTLTITPTTIAFDQGEKSEYCVIVAVTQEPGNDGATIYTIAYDGIEGGEYSVPLVYEPARGGALRFLNQPALVFTRREG